MSDTKSALKIEEREGITVVSFRDASILDALSIQRIGKELYDVVETLNRTRIVLDFAEVRFLSSQALGVLLTLRRKADKVSATVVLAAIRPELYRVFTITNLNKLFSFFKTADEAVASFAK